MNQEIIERFINHWRKDAFMELLLILFFSYCIILGLFYNHKKKERLLFLAYFFVGTILFVSLDLVIAFKLLTGKIYYIYIEVANTIFELAEFTAFYYFFKACLQRKIFKKTSKIFLAILLSIIIFFFIGLSFIEYSQTAIKRHSLFINVIELFFLFTMCLAYFYELLTNIPKTNLFQRPSFFIVASTFFYTALIIPFFMLADDILKISASIYTILYAWHYLLLIIVLFSISKAFLCRTPITT